MTFPTIDLTAISTQMGNFWSFISPALYVVGGIGLGGYIVGKVRGLL